LDHWVQAKPGIAIFQGEAINFKQNYTEEQAFKFLWATRTAEKTWMN
jgi:hypothetical protein